MPEQRDHLTFDVSANLQRLIGRELIQTEEAAVAELVKNAYDANAKHAVVTVTPESQKQPGSIEVRDDGQGMTLKDIERLFMFAGYSEKGDQSGTKARVPTGEKGLGRFAADKLGKDLVVLTKVAGSREGIEIRINWEVFANKKKKFYEITVPFKRSFIRELARHESGTILRITRLRTRWTREKILSLQRYLAELLDPFKPPSDFEIELEVPGSARLSGSIRQLPPTHADIEFRFSVLSNGRVKRRVNGKLYEREAEEEAASLANTEALQGLSGRFLYWIKRPKKDHTRGLNPGVRLYRDGIRIEPFGSPPADWLGLSEKRAKRAGHAHIVPTRLLGFVEITRRKHPDIRDTTSRQALIDNEAARGLVTLLREQIAFLEVEIRTKVAEPRWEESKTRQVIELQRARLQTLAIHASGLAHELRQPLQSIRTEADNVRTRLKHLGIDDADIRESQQSIDADIERINQTVSLISNIATGNIHDITSFDLAEMVREHCKFFHTRCALSEISLNINTPQSQMATFNPFAIQTVLTNFLQNSIDALQETQDDRKRTITVTLSRVGSRHQLRVTDTGHGIQEELMPKIFREFVTSKTGGMGVGLHHCNVIMKAHGGEIAFETKEGIGTTFYAEFTDKAITSQPLTK